MGETKTARAQPLFLGAEFNAFLFEPIGADSLGRQVTVVSAIARLGMDPWAEADRLSRLPDETAARRVSMVLSRSPDIALGIAGTQRTAQRLVRLLPNRPLARQVNGPLARAAALRALPRAVAAGMFCAFAILFLGQVTSQSHHVVRMAPQTAIAVQAASVARAPVVN